MPSIKIYSYDIPEELLRKNINTLSIDTEALGLNIHRDRLCTVQFLCNEENMVHIVHFPQPQYHKSVNLIKLLSDNKIMKIFHFARFDIAIIYKYLGVLMKNIVCNRLLSKLVRTFSDRHGLKELCKSILGIDLNKGEQCSNWASEQLTQNQTNYAAKDVVYLLQIYRALLQDAQRENKERMLSGAFEAIIIAAQLDCEHYDLPSLLNH